MPSGDKPETPLTQADLAYAGTIRHLLVNLAAGFLSQLCGSMLLCVTLSHHDRPKKRRELMPQQKAPRNWGTADHSGSQKS